MINLVSIDTKFGFFRRYECTPGVKPRQVGRIDMPDWATISSGAREVCRESIETFRRNG